MGSTDVTGPPEVSHICALLAERYGQDGEAAGNHLRRWLSGGVPEAYTDEIARHLREEHLPLLFDAFRTQLAFGTAGARGPVGYGPNRFNTTTVLKTVQGHCDYLKSVFPARERLQVIVANDVRVFRDLAGRYAFLPPDHALWGISSRELARRACEVYAGNGIVSFLAEPENPDALLSTPMLSFLIAQLPAEGGINLSASHNPPDDNGIKVYDPYGGQLLPPQDEILSQVVERVEHVRTLPFAQARNQGLIQPVPGELLERYVATYVSELGLLCERRESDLPIVYTPLCGCGLTTVGEVFTALGMRYLVPPGEGPDGTFQAIPLRVPNPEVPISATPAKAFADHHGLGLVLSSDPDADRVGAEERAPGGSWHHFDGNQIAAILGYYLMLDPQGPQKRGLVLESLVTTRLLGAVVREAARSGDCWIIDDLLVGFKYIADVLKNLDESGRFREVSCRSDQLVLAAEESHGIGMLPQVRDKDSCSACLCLAALYQRLRRENVTLVEYYAAMLRRLGCYDSVARSIVMSGAVGEERKARLMASLRSSPPLTLAGEAVIRTDDRWDEQTHGEFVSETDRHSRNVIQYVTPAYLVAIRPSGTEPKLRVYCELMPQEVDPSLGAEQLLAHLREKTEACARGVCHELLSRVGVPIGEAGLRILDVVDIDYKIDFEARLVPLLRERLTAASPGELEGLLAWLRDETRQMIPGVDTLSAIQPALAYLTEEWAEALQDRPLFRALREWAAGAS